MQPVDSAREPPLISVVVPCYNEDAVIAETHKRLSRVLEGAGATYEIIYVDDGSSDRTWPMLEAFSASSGLVTAIRLSRNFGHQLALTAGLSLSRGERILMIDADLQDPPELLPEMMAVMDVGADVVYGQRTERLGETAFKRSTAALFYRMLNKLTDVPIPQDVGDFRLVNRKVLDALLSLPEQHRFVRGLVAWLGFRQVAFPYVRQERFAGVTKYPLRRMFRLAVDAVTGFSIKPLRIGVLFALVSLVAALLLAIYALVSWLTMETVRGWTSLIIVLALFASGQFFCLGIFGEYLGRMFQQLKGRPLYLISEISGRSQAESPGKGGNHVVHP